MQALRWFEGGEVSPAHLLSLSCEGRESWSLPPLLINTVCGFQCRVFGWASSGVAMANSALLCCRIFDEVMGCFCDSPPQSPTFPEAGHASLYDEDKVR